MSEMRRCLGLAGRMPARTGRMPALPPERNFTSLAVIFEIETQRKKNPGSTRESLEFALQ